MVEREEKQGASCHGHLGEEKGTAEPGGKNRQLGKLRWGENPSLL